MNAAAWMASLSAAGRESAAVDADRDRMTPRIGDETAHETWDGTKWCERILVWTGDRYEVAQ